MAFRLPFGFDKADGVTPIPLQPKGSVGSFEPVGTPNPTDGLQVYNDPDGTNIQGGTDEVEIERAEQATSQHLFRTTYENAVSLLSVMGRGTFVEDSGTFTNGVRTIWRILSSKLKSIRGGYAEISTVAESISFDSPPDDYQMIPVELGIDILKHPRYSWALNPTVNDQSVGTTVGDTPIYFSQIKESIMRMIQTYRDSPFYPSADNINGLIQNNITSQIKSGILSINYPNPAYNPSAKTFNPVSWDGTTANLPTTNCQYFVIGVPVDLDNPADTIAIAIAAAKEVIGKLWRQEDTPYVVGFQVTWTQYFFAPVYENPGGYIENPVGIVPDYFLSPSQNGTDTIFDQMALVNPQCYSDDGTPSGNLDISWLRKADEVVYERTWFKVTRTWLGAPIGKWDADLHTQGNRPQNADDFNQLYN